MFGRQVKLPVELMYGTPEPESQSSTEYTTQLESTLTEAYEKVRANTFLQLEQNFFNEKILGRQSCMGSISTGFQK